MAKLLDIILSLDAEDARAVSSIRVERANNKTGWQVRLNIHRNKYDQDSSQSGVSVMGWTRVPEQIYPLSLDEIEPNADIAAQASALQQTGVLGRLDMARHDRDDRSTSYLIKTHAGSQSERSAWLMRLKERPENIA